MSLDRKEREKRERVFIRERERNEKKIFFLVLSTLCTSSEKKTRLFTSLDSFETHQKEKSKERKRTHLDVRYNKFSNDNIKMSARKY